MITRIILSLQQNIIISVKAIKSKIIYLFSTDNKSPITLVVEKDKHRNFAWFSVYVENAGFDCCQNNNKKVYTIATHFNTMLFFGFTLNEKAYSRLMKLSFYIANLSEGGYMVYWSTITRYVFRKCFKMYC
jgi:hypothetical protein